VGGPGAVETVVVFPRRYGFAALLVQVINFFLKSLA